MSPRTRVVGIVALVAAVAAGAVVGVTLLQTHGESTGTTARKGAPPLDIPASGALATAVKLYSNGKRAQAGVIFGRFHTLPAEIGSAFSTWPHGSLDAMRKIVAANPQSGLAELHLGLAEYWSGRDADAAAAWKRAAKVEPDSPAAIASLDFLHPNVAPGLPPIVFDTTGVPAAARRKLVTGVNLWSRERPVSARKEFAAALAVAPNDPVVRTAAAVATFSPATPLAPFPKLGPLTAAFPKAAVVRFHLGELLLWTRQVKKGEAQLRIAGSTEPGSVYARAADKILGLLQKDGTK